MLHNQHIAVESPWLEHYPSSVPPHLVYPETSLDALLDEPVRRCPERVVCQYYQQRITYAYLYERSCRFAASLIQHGLQPGDRVAILLPNIPEYLIALFGIWKAGGVAVPLNPLMVAEEIAGILHATESRRVVALDLLLPLLGTEATARPDVIFVTSLRDRLPWWDRVLYGLARFSRLRLHARYHAKHEPNFTSTLDATPPFESTACSEPNTLAIILPTGGTTGRPKAVMLSHRNLIANALQVNAWSQRPFACDTVMACLPFFHCYGLTTCALSSVANGATLILHHRFRAEVVLRSIEQTRPTLLPAVPAMLVAFNRMLAHRAYDLRSIDLVISGGAPLPESVAVTFAKYTGAVVVEGYGLSEASPVTHVGPLDGSAQPGTIGFPLPDTHAMIVDANNGSEPLPPGEVGELIIRGPQVMAGYWNDGDATAEALRDGWLHTGDLAVMDAKGFFKIVDRKKDLIITSGFNVYPTDVEFVLRKFDGIDDVAVFGVPDPLRGELVKAVFVMKEGAKFHQRHFDDFARQHLEVHKRPRIVEVVRGPLPRNPLGKVLRRVLREQHAKGIERTAGEPAAA